MEQFNTHNNDTVNTMNPFCGAFNIAKGDNNPQ